MSDEVQPEPKSESLIEQVARIHDESRQLFEQLVTAERRYRSLARAVWRTEEEERRRLASEIHDGLGQMLTALKIHLERLHEWALPLDGKLAQELSIGASLAHRSLEDARRVSHLLRPRVLDDLGLSSALAWLARSFDEWAGFAVRVDIEGLGEQRLSSELETLVFRVAQEALTNAVRHSETGKAEARLVLKAGFLQLLIRDQGCGFDASAVLNEPGEGVGLRGLRDRVEVFGGRFHVRSAPGSGTTIEATIPTGGTNGQGGPYGKAHS